MGHSIKSSYVCMFDRKSFNDGLSSSIPICLAFTLLFSSLGLFANSKGLNFIEAVFLTATIFAGPSQVFVMDNQDLSFWVLAANIFVLNFKFLLMSILAISLWHNRKRFRIPGLFFMCSSAYLVYSTRADVKDPWSYFMGIVTASYVVAVVSTMAGYLVWDTAVDYRFFLSALAHIVLPIHFVCLIVKRKTEATVLNLSLFSIIVSPFLEMLIGRQFIILAWFFIAFIVVMIEDKLCGK